jgi:hypothetical protein
MSPVAAHRSIETRTLTRIENRNDEWIVVGEELFDGQWRPTGEVEIEYEPQRLRDYSLESAVEQGPVRRNATFSSLKPRGGTWAVQVAHPCLLDRFEDARFLESHNKKGDGSKRRRSTIEAAARAREGIDEHMYARQRTRGQAYDPHETNEQRYTATFHIVKRFADGFRSLRRATNHRVSSKHMSGERFETKFEPTLAYGLCGADPEVIVADLLAHPEVKKLGREARRGELFAKQHSGSPWIGARAMNEQTVAFATDALRAACYWSLGGPNVAKGQLLAWTSQYEGREGRPLWHLVREIYLRILWAVDRRFQRAGEKADASTWATVGEPADVSRDGFEAYVDAIVVDEIVPQIEAGEFDPVEYAGLIRDQLTSSDTSGRVLACARTVAALQRPEIFRLLPTGALIRLRTDSSNRHTQLAATWALEMIDEIRRTR